MLGSLRTSPSRCAWLASRRAMRPQLRAQPPPNHRRNPSRAGGPAPHPTRSSSSEQICTSQPPPPNPSDANACGEPRSATGPRNSLSPTRSTHTAEPAQPNSFRPGLCAVMNGPQCVRAHRRGPDYGARVLCRSGRCVSSSWRAHLAPRHEGRTKARAARLCKAPGVNGGTRRFFVAILDSSTWVRGERSRMPDRAQVKIGPSHRHFRAAAHAASHRCTWGHAGSAAAFAPAVTDVLPYRGRGIEEGCSCVRRGAVAVCSQPRRWRDQTR
jgi:hypothetical protein